MMVIEMGGEEPSHLSFHWPINRQKFKQKHQQPEETHTQTYKHMQESI